MKQSFVTRIALWSARHAWLAIAAWVVFAAAAVLVGGAVGTRSVTDAELGVGESGHAAAIVRDAGLAPPATESVLVSTRSGAIDPAVDYAAELAVRLRSVQGVAQVEAPIAGTDRSTVLIPVTLAGDPNTAADRIEPVLAAIAAAQSQRPDLRIERVGNASGQHDVEAQLGHDFERAEFLSVPLTLAILVVAFGAIVAAGVPLVLALSSVAAAVGLSGLVSHVIPDAGTTTNMILLMGMAVGVDYSMFYVRREREERARGRARLEATHVAAATAGRAALMSGSAVIVTMAGLYVTRDVTFSSLATGSILVVLVAMAGCLTVLPALLMKLGNAVDWPRLRRRGDKPARLWPALLRPALRRPALTLTLSTVGMIALAAPLVNLKLGSVGIADMPDEIPAVQAYQRLVTAFPVRVATHQVAVQAPAEQADAVEAALAALGDHNDIRASADGRTHVLTLPADDGDANTVRSLREQANSTLASIPGVTYAVGGGPAEELDYAQHQREKLPWVIGVVFALTFLVMLLAFRSAILAAVSIAVNALSAAAAFGVLVLIFQQHWAEGLLNFRSTGTVVSWIPLFLFVVLFGLSMDYHIFVLSRIREATTRGATLREAVAEGITTSAPVVTSAAAVMIAVFATFATLSLMEFKQLGAGLATAVLLDAVVVRILILPAAIALLGKRVRWARTPSTAESHPAPVLVSSGSPI
jgi:RND superfamily putative drug exporter